MSTSGGIIDNPDDPAASREMKILELCCSAKSSLAEMKGERRGETKGDEASREGEEGRERLDCSGGSTISGAAEKLFF